MKRILAGLGAILLIANFAVWHALYIESQDRELTVAFLDVGQGDAIFIEAPNGNQVLVDGGPSAKVLHEIGTLMPWYDKSVDMIVVTNPDKDHIAGFVDVLKRYDVSYLLESGTKNSSLTHNTLQELAHEKGIEKVLARRGLEIFLDDDVTLTVLFPDKDVSEEKTNDGSIVMRLRYGESEVVLTGDAPESVENHILALNNADPNMFEGFKLDSDILKVGHHGSKTSTNENFVQVIDPEYAVISSGKENKYGHPHEDVLATLSKFPLQVLRTDQMGTIVMKSDGKKFRLEN